MLSRSVINQICTKSNRQVSLLHFRTFPTHQRLIFKHPQSAPKHTFTATPLPTNFKPRHKPFPFLAAVPFSTPVPFDTDTINLKLSEASQTVSKTFEKSTSVLQSAAEVASTRLKNVSEELKKLGQDIGDKVEDSYLERSPLEQLLVNYSRWLERTLEFVLPIDATAVSKRVADIWFYAAIAFASFISLAALGAVHTLLGFPALSQLLIQPLWRYWFPTGLIFATFYTGILFTNYHLQTARTQDLQRRQTVQPAQYQYIR